MDEGGKHVIGKTCGQ